MERVPEISVVVPVFCSEKILPLLVDLLDQLFRHENIHYEIIFVDDASMDNTWKCIEKLMSSNSNVKGVRLTNNQGQFKSSLIGIQKSSGKYILNMDDDLEHPINEIMKMYRMLIASPDLQIVFGMDDQKYIIKGSKWNLQLWRNRFLNILWNKYPTDSFRIFRRELVFSGDKFLVKSPMFEIFLKHYLKKEEVGYLPINRSHRYDGQSNVSFMKKFKFFLQFTPYFMFKSLNR